MSHYFIEDTTLKSKERDIEFDLESMHISLKSDSGVFSNKHIDVGTLIFINTLIKLSLKGKVLDLGCGYGPVGISLSLYYKDNIDLTYVDINPKCIELTSRNLKYYDLDGKCLVSDGYLNISDKYDYVVFNPPISVGKTKIYSLYQESYYHLNENGIMYLVIRKDKGGLSHLKYLSSLFAQSCVIYKEKGYLIIECKKQGVVENEII